MCADSAGIFLQIAILQTFVQGCLSRPCGEDFLPANASGTWSQPSRNRVQPSCNGKEHNNWTTTGHLSNGTWQGKHGEERLTTFSLSTPAADPHSRAFIRSAIALTTLLLIPPQYPPFLPIFPPPSTTPPPLPAMSETKRDIKNSLLFECAWEVANKVGGIYTVIKTKVPVTVSEYGDRYCLIGPLSYKSAPMEVEAQEPEDPHLAGTLESLRAAGVKSLYGRWLVEGNPHVLLFDTGSQYIRLDEWKGDLWNLAGIPTPPNDHETNETIVFGYIVAWFLGEVRHPLPYLIYSHLSLQQLLLTFLS